MAAIKNCSHSEGLDIIKYHTTQVLDKYCPFNPAEKKVKKIYRNIMSAECRRIKRERISCLNNVRKLIKRKAVEAMVSAAKADLKTKTKAYKKLLKKERSSSSITMHNKISKNNFWKFINDSKSNNEIDVTLIELSIKGKSGSELANHMAEYLHMRANLVSNVDVEKIALIYPCLKKCQMML